MKKYIIARAMYAEETSSHPTEFLNPLGLPETPSYQLQLKIGISVILLNNLDATKLCSGT